ncbi:MAG: alpha/beta hydrolase fold domain-containing protein [Deltaproteobacteria bacterium]|jgi:acetyl esterase/lipase|nr:alpha/beta hydrolase fold domain-containing protein [Deltaproteobacteria bacterium]
MKKHFQHFTLNSPLNDILNHPAFLDFGPLILPTTQQFYDDKTTIKHIEELMPLHSCINATNILKSLNAMIDLRREGYNLFYRFYSDKDIELDPTKNNTGLFFFKGKPEANWLLICPGGAFQYVASLHEGFPYAVHFKKYNFNVFVLRYRTGSLEDATADLAAAAAWILSRANKFRLKATDWSLWGSSAGANIAAAFSAKGFAAYGLPDAPKPAALLFQYAVIDDFGAQDPPSFTVVGALDRRANPTDVVACENARVQAGLRTRHMIFPDVGHGFGLGLGTPAEDWIDLAVMFWQACIAAAALGIRSHPLFDSRR